ncbi:hypothetical protein BDN70DRAFT_881953, partial [Pholiota conissans]
MTTTSLPPEICAIVCNLIHHDDLLALATVSRVFRAEAERLLYLSVELRSKRRFKSFCLAVIRRPYLVRRLHTLVMIMPPPMDLEIADFERITKMLHLSTNLQHLRVLSERTEHSPPTNGDAIPTWIIEGHSFQLKSFENAYFEQGMIWRFLRAQPTIETLVMNAGATTLTGVPMPNLKNLSCCSESLQGLNAPSQSEGCLKDVERLQLYLVKTTELEHLMMLARLRSHLRPTLKSLSISRYYCRPVGMRLDLLLYTLAAQVPDLKYLRILDYSVETQEHLIPFLAGLPIAFTQLETLVLRPAMMVDTAFADDPPQRCACKELRTASGRSDAAIRAMLMLPSLTRVVFIIDEEIHEYRVNECDENWCCIACGMKTSQLTELDADEWMKVE